MKTVKKAVIPAAGTGSRLTPLTNYLPKAMLPLGKKPVLEHIIDELKGAGINEIVVIINSTDQMMVDYFDTDNSINFIIDDSYSGPGGAILKAESFVGGEDFIVVFSDAPIKGRERSSYLKDLKSLKNKKEVMAALAIYPINKSEASSRGVVKFCDQEHPEEQPVQLKDIIEKPSTTTGTLWATACRYVLGPQVFDRLKEIPKNQDGELQLTPAIRKIIKGGDVVLGYPLPEGVTRYDTGNFSGYFEALRAFMPSQNKEL